MEDTGIVIYMTSSTFSKKSSKQKKNDHIYSFLVEPIVHSSVDIVNLPCIWNEGQMDLDLQKQKLILYSTRHQGTMHQ